jgi:hypothetical protein
MSLKLCNFRVAVFEFSLRFQESAVFGESKGSSLRGALGQALEETCFNKSKRCKDCIHTECAYGYLFKTPSFLSPKISRKYSAIPHPFVLEPPLTKKTHFKAGESLKFRLILIGKGISYLPYFLDAFQQGDKNGIGLNRAKYELTEVFSIFGRHREKIYDSESKRFQMTYRIWHFEDILQNSSLKPPLENLSLRFLTPMRLKYHGRFVSQNDFQFHIFFRSLLRRISELSLAHCDEELPQHYGDLKQKAMTIETEGKLSWGDEWEHFSKEEAEKMKLGGLIGEITFRGQLDEFLPFLKIGQIVHVGGKTVFGNGKYILG